MPDLTTTHMHRQGTNTEAPADFDNINLVALLNNTKDLMWSISTEGNMLAFNRAFDEIVKLMTGHPVVKGGSAPVIGFSEQQLSRWQGYYSRAFAGETFSIEEYTDSPVEYWSETSFYPLVQNNVVIGAACYSRDITERKFFARELEQRNLELENIKNQLLESENSLNEAQQMAHVGSWSTDFITGKTYWSEELFNIFGLSKNSARPSLETYFSVIHKEDVERVKSLVEQGNKLREGYSFYCRIAQSNGNERYVYCNCKFVTGASGLPVKIHGIVHDITERTKAEEKLLHSELRLKQAQTIAHVGNWEADLATGESVWSDEAYRIYGLEPNGRKIAFSEWLRYVHPEDADAFMKEIKRSEKNYEDLTFYHRIIRPDGNIRFVISECRYEFSNGKPLNIYGTVQDITEQVAMEEKLMHSHRLLEKLTEYMPAAVYQFEMDSDGKMTFPYMSKGIHNLLPGTDTEFIKTDASVLFNFVHPDDVAPLIASIELSRQQLTNWESEYRAIHNNQIKWLHGAAQPEKKENGITVWYGYLQDITERKLAQEKIRITKERYDMVAQATNDAIYDRDLTTGIVTRTGDGLKNLFGYDPDEAARDLTFWENRIHPDDMPGVKNTFIPIMADPAKNTFEIEYRFRKNDGAYAYIYDKGFIMRDANGKAMRIIGAKQDITERKHSEVLLKELNERLERRAEELVRSNTELEHFAYIASHDLQEPLRMVTSFLTQLERRYNDQLDDKARQYIHFATDGAARMRRIILDLLEYSRVGRRPDEKKQVDTNEVLFEAVQLNRAVIDEKKAVIQWRNLPVLKASKMALQQLLQNLIGNALKYQKADQQPVIEISASETCTHWQFSVKDNGIGIEPQFFEKIFAVFQRLHNREEYSGTGIGLAICKKIVESHGGQIWVESERHVGSTFHFTLEKV